MNGARVLDEPMKRCVRRASIEVRTILQKLHSELAICNKLALRVIKGEGEKKSMLKEFMESAKQIARDAKQVIHVCTGEEQENFFKCLADTLRNMKTQKVEGIKRRNDPKIPPAEMDQLLECYTNSFTVAQTRLMEAEKKFKDCIKETKQG